MVRHNTLHRAAEQLQQQRLGVHIRLLSRSGRIGLTCGGNPSRLIWVIIKRRCVNENIRGEKENRREFEEPHEYNARCSSMKDQEPLWDSYGASHLAFL